MRLLSDLYLEGPLFWTSSSRRSLSVEARRLLYNQLRSARFLLGLSLQSNGDC